jgi:hypothetical protein
MTVCDSALVLTSRVMSHTAALQAMIETVIVLRSQRTINYYFETEGS